MGRRINTKQEEGSNETWSFEMEASRSSPTDLGFSAVCLTRFAQNRVNDDRMRQSLLFTACVCVCQSRKKGTNMRKGIETEGMRMWGCVKVSMCSLKEKKRREGAWKGESCTPVSKDLLTK